MGIFIQGAYCEKSYNIKWLDTEFFKKFPLAPLLQHGEAEK
jgi:hypothetical protein